MLLQAPAKINWSLDVTGVRADGYHLLDTVMQSVALHDTVGLERAEELTFRVAGSRFVPRTADNLALRAAQLLREHTGYHGGAEIALTKRVPVGAGLGGGSADAAAVLKGLNSLWNLGLSHAELCMLGLKLGADVPFCLTGGLCRAQGVGEVLTPCPGPKPHWLVLIQPCRGLSTKQVFGKMGDAPPDSAHRPDNEGLLRALAQGDIRAIAACMGNALQPVAITLRPQIAQALRSLREHGARAAQMTGSGCAVFGLFSTYAAARRACDALTLRYKTTILTQTIADAGD